MVSDEGEPVFGGIAASPQALQISGDSALGDYPPLAFLLPFAGQSFQAQIPPRRCRVPPRLRRRSLLILFCRVDSSFLLPNAARCRNTGFAQQVRFQPDLLGATGDSAQKGSLIRLSLLLGII